MNDNRLQRRLLAEANLTSKKAYAIAQAMETAERSAKELQGTAADCVHGVYAKKGGGARGDLTSKCYRCLGHHNPSNCKFKMSE